MNPTLSVSPQELALVVAILRQHVPQRKVSAFGSRVRGGAKKFSDLDLAILGEQPVSLLAMADLAEAFSESDLPYKVDLVDWATASEPFRRIIQEAHIVLDLPDVSGRSPPSRSVRRLPASASGISLKESYTKLRRPPQL